MISHKRKGTAAVRNSCSDAFSRQLEAQESGNGQTQLRNDAQTPLMADRRVRMTLRLPSAFLFI